MSKIKSTVALLAGALFASAASAWTPDKPVEFVVTAGAGGGTDTFARTIQSIIVKYKLMNAPIVVVNKGGGGGGEGFVYGSSQPGDPYRVTFGTNNQYLQPLVAKMGFTAESFTPVAAMAKDGAFAEKQIGVIRNESGEKEAFAKALLFDAAAYQGLAERIGKFWSQIAQIGGATEFDNTPLTNLPGKSLEKPPTLLRTFDAVYLQPFFRHVGNFQKNPFHIHQLISPDDNYYFRKRYACGGA